MIRSARLVGLLLLLAATVAGAHDRHVTFAEVRHALDVGTLQVVLDLDTADLRLELAAHEAAASDSALAALVDDRFVVRDEAGERIPMRWIGEEVGPLDATLYFEFEVPDDLDGLTLENRFGIAFHRLQTNTVNVHADGTMRTLVLTPERPAGPLTGD